jgi:hypothetical protein
MEKFDDGVVLSSPEIGSLIPFISNKFAVLGPSEDIVYFSDRYEDYITFYSKNTSTNERIKILKKYLGFRM